MKSNKGQRITARRSKFAISFSGGEGYAVGGSSGLMEPEETLIGQTQYHLVQVHTLGLKCAVAPNCKRPTEPCPIASTCSNPNRGA